MTRTKLLEGFVALVIVALLVVALYAVTSRLQGDRSVQPEEHSAPKLTAAEVIATVQRNLQKKQRLEQPCEVVPAAPWTAIHHAAEHYWEVKRTNEYQFPREYSIWRYYPRTGAITANQPC